MRIKNRNSWPPGGWIFYQPQSNWWAPDPMSNSFSMQVENIISHRVKNPRFNLPTDHKAVESDLDNYTCARLNGNPQFCFPDPSTPTPDPSEDQKKKLISSSSEVSHNNKPKGLAARLAERGKHLREGKNILAAWFGEGMNPVPQMIADRRARVCLTCPEHDKGNWFDKVTGAIAEGVKDFASLKNFVGMKVERESELSTCGVCTCHLPTKVWIPIQTIRNNMDQETVLELDNACWIRQEPEPELETIIIQLGRVGDLLNILPVAKAMHDRTGRKTRVITHESNAPIMERAPYCETILWTGDPKDAAGAARMAQKLDFEPPGIKIVCCMFFGNMVQAGRHYSNFLIEQWGLLGYAKEWGKLPLVLERDQKAEQRVMDELRAEGDYIVISTESYSSPPPKIVQEYIASELSGLRGIDVSRFKTPNFVDMLGVMENAKAVVTVDSGIAHLNRATKTPLVILGKDIEKAWHFSSNIENVAASVSYASIQDGNNVGWLRNLTNNLLSGQWLPWGTKACGKSVTPDVVITGGDNNFRPLANLCRQSLENAKLGKVIQFVPLPEAKGKAPSWWKLKAMLDVLDVLDQDKWAMWVDADCIVKPGTILPPVGEFDMMISQDWNGICMALFACKNTFFVRQLLGTLLMLGDSRVRENVHGKNDGPKWEQDAMKSVRAFFPEVENRTSLLPLAFTTDHPQDDPTFKTPVHHWGGRPFNLRVTGMKKDLGTPKPDTLLSFCYLPPGHVNPKCTIAFRENMADWKANFRVIYLSDDPSWLPDRIIPEIVPGKNSFETAGRVFQHVMLAAEDYGSEYFLVLEPDCRVKGDHWDQDILSNRGFLVSGTPVSFNTDINGDELTKKTCEILGRASVKIKPLHGEWIQPNQWALFPNGGLAVYKTKEAVEAWREADRSLPWDMAIGMALARRHPDYLDRFSVNRSVLSFSCEAWMKREEMKRQLESGQVVGIHNIKDGWKPEKV